VACQATRFPSSTPTIPLGGAKLPGIAVEDVGKCALGIFREGTKNVGSYIGVAGEILSGEEMVAKMSAAMGKTIHFYDVPFDDYRKFGFPGAEDLGNMFQYQQMFAEEFYKARDPRRTRELNPELMDFDAWLAKYASQIPIAG